jgi:hypothetical protein
MKLDPHAVWLAKQVVALDAASPSGQARRRWEQGRIDRWEGLAVGDKVALSGAALQGLQGHGAPLRLDPSTTIGTILRIDVERGLALVSVSVELGHGCRGSVANEYPRSEILPVVGQGTAAEVAAPPAPPPPPPPIHRPPPSKGRNRSRLPSVW